MEKTECSKISELKMKMPVKYPKQRMLHLMI